ncbi:MAG: hypothetical protein IJF78_08765 [Clostridia bacterium]|nr:hypothetical protein [Clostridia bacterium]
MLKLFILLLAAMILPSCADLSGEATETEEYVPEREVSDYEAYASGASVFLDWSTVRNVPLLDYGEFDDLKKIKFVKNKPEDRRYIEYDTLEAVRVEQAGGTMVDSARPNGNFLTGGAERIKLCTDKVCRENDEMPCTHLSLVGGHVWEDYVYFIAKYKAEEQETGQWSIDYENYLMRYSILNHEMDVVVRLPWHCTITRAAYGVLYIAYTQDVEFTLTQYNRNLILYDCANERIAMIEDFDGLFLTSDHFGAAAQANESFYYFDGRNFIKQSCDFSEQVTLGAPDLGESHAVIVTQLGYGRDRVFYSVYDFLTQKTTVRTLKDDGHRRTVAENCIGAALLTDGPLTELYTIEADENGVREIVRYSLDMLGLSDIRTVVAREGETLAVNEHITGLYSEMRDVYFTTEFGENTGHTRAYLIHEHSTELVDEDGAPEQADEISDIHAENTD